MPLIPLYAPPPAPVVAAPQTGLIAYPPVFFASSGAANAFEMLLRLPGFVIDGGEQVRGFGGAAGNVLIDGRRPSTKSDDIEEVLRRIPAGKVERVELIRGGAPGVDMQGKSVVVNVVRKAGGGRRGLVAMANGVVVKDGRSIPSYRLEASGDQDGRTWEASLRQGRGIDDGAGGGPGVRTDAAGRVLSRSDIRSQGDGWQTTATAAYELPVAGGRFRINGRLFTDRFRTDETQTFTVPTAGFQQSRSRSPETEAELGGRFVRSVGSKSEIELIGLRQTEDEAYRESFAPPVGPSSEFGVQQRSSESVGRVILRVRRSEQLSWEAGGEAALNKLNSATRFSENGAAIPLPAADVQVREKRAEAFVNVTWRPSPKFQVEGSLKQEASKISSDGDVALAKALAFTKPRLAVSWTPKDGSQVRLRLERIVGQLDFDAFVAEAALNQGQVTAGNPDLNPETAWVAEAAFERRLSWGATGVVTLRHFRLSNVVDVGPVFSGDGSVFDNPANIGPGTKAELQATITLPFDRLPIRILRVKGAQLRGDTTWRRSRVTDPTTGEMRTISGLRHLEWEAHFTHDLPQWKLTWGVDAFGAWREAYFRSSNKELVKLRTYVTGFVEYRPKPNLQLRAELQNATSRGLRVTRYLYDGPRGAAPLAAINDRHLQFGPMVWFRVRRTFG
ncbi:TonB-dependent receptor plug domain-containing protein [Phenylobacterium immobile]|uniref:TonB-dependent receptor plug domain-containing protein n=1 Tax=Phenylobacterium immobile TaxID=21 RepID=UPI000B123AEA|nr:TonB-dependent receptor [Phenylobacterium immobile]